MASTNERKILRIGIIQNAKVIEERLVRKREGVTIGQGPKNTFVLPVGSLPRSYPLFELKGGIYHLNFKGDMEGRVSVDDAVLDFDALKKRNLASQKGDHYSLKLSERSRGKIVIGEVTLLFQFVTPPPPPSRLQLPASVRGGVAKNVDWPFVSILMASMIVQVFSVVFMVTRDYPEPPKGIEALPDRFVEVLDIKKPEVKPIEEKEDPVKDEPEEKVAEEKPQPKPKVKKPKPKPEQVAKQDPPKTEQEIEKQARAEDKQFKQMRKKVRDKTVLSVLGTAGGDGPGSIVDSLTDGATNVALKDAFDGTKGVAMAEAAGAGRDTRSRVAGKGVGEVAKVSNDELLGERRVAKGPTAKKAEKKVRGNLKVASKASSEFGLGSLDGRKVASVIKRRSGALKACYEKRLKKNPDLSGKVVVQFEVLESGRVGQVSVKSNTTRDNELASCLQSNFKRFRFPRPDGGSVNFAFPFVFSPQG